MKEGELIQNSKIEIANCKSSDFLGIKQDENYIKNTFISHIKSNLIIIILSIITIISEIIYRDALFEFSLDFEEDWQENSPKQIINFFKIITKFGGEYLMPVPIVFIFCFFSLIESSIYIFGLIFVLHFHSMMKIWYGSIRPFWKNKDLFQEICDGGFGNPSGHSITSTYLYLMLFIYLSQTKLLYKRYIIQSLLFLLLLTLIILIILSRLILGFHSINQVIYGSTLGLIMVLLISIVFKLNQMPVTYYKKLFKEKIYIIIIFSLILFLSIFSIISNFAFDNKSTIKKYEKVLDEKCQNLPEYRKFNLDGLYGSFIIFCLLGMYSGQIVFWYLIDNNYKKNKKRKKIKSRNLDHNNSSVNEDIIGDTVEEEENGTDNSDNDDNDDADNENNRRIDELINNWNENRVLLFSTCGRVIKIIFVVILCFTPPLLLLILIPDNINIVTVFIFKFGIPFFSLTFLLYGFGFYHIINISCGPKKILLKQINKEDNIV